MTDFEEIPLCSFDYMHFLVGAPYFSYLEVRDVPQNSITGRIQSIMEDFMLGRKKKLEEYVLRKRSRVCEMHVFRRLKRESNDTRQDIC